MIFLLLNSGTLCERDRDKYHMVCFGKGERRHYANSRRFKLRSGDRRWKLPVDDMKVYKGYLL